MVFRKFHSKLILFGEYTIMQSSHALAVPFLGHEGVFSFLNGSRTTNEIKSNKTLEKLSEFLAPLVENESLSIDIELFKEDIKKGLFFESNIPHGYGLGSSGALSASVYQHYSETFPNNLEEIRIQLSLIEAFFHGTSSGIDPLVSYCNKALFLSKNHIEPIDKVINEHSPIKLFLVDSGLQRKTEPLIEWYKKECENDFFSSLVTNELIPAVNLAITSLLESETEEFFEQLRTISSCQLSLFKPMVLPEYNAIWHEGLKNNAYFLKFCGAGGGGYLLGFCRSYEDLGNSFPFIPLPHLP